MNNLDKLTKNQNLNIKMGVGGILCGGGGHHKGSAGGENNK